MYKIKFGTDGWRAIIADTYTIENLKRVAYATAQWVKQNENLNQNIVLGYDCRFGGELFAKTTAAVYASKGLKVLMTDTFVTTPMISMGAMHYKSALGIILTASHNPPSYNGYKVKANFGGPASPQVITEIENLIPEQFTGELENFDTYKEKGLIEFIDLDTLYYDMVDKAFDLNSINNLKFGYDAMYGSGMAIGKKIMPNATYLHCNYNPSFMGQAPEPIHKNLTEFSELLKNSNDLQAGLANDGDADRIGLYDNVGNFVDSHHIILLLIHYLHKVKNYTGKVVIAASVTDKVKKLCDIYNLEYEVTRVGFKYIAQKMVDEDVLIGAEESGGIAVKGHIPERDGIWVGLLIFEYMAKTGKSLKALIDEIYEQVGPFFYKRNDLHITEALKLGALEKCKAGIKQFGDFEVVKEDNTDGFRYTLPNDQWLMIRASGTEPVLRVYAESADEAGAEKILAAAQQVLL